MQATNRPARTPLAPIAPRAPAPRAHSRVRAAQPGGPDHGAAGEARANDLEGTISAARGEQIARHVKRALTGAGHRVAA
jgi:hypothetical protein